MCTCLLTHGPHAWKRTYVLAPIFICIYLVMHTSLGCSASFTHLVLSCPVSESGIGWGVGLMSHSAEDEAG